MQSEGIGGEYSQSGLLFMEFMCEKLDSHVYVDPNILSMTIATFLMLGN